MIKKMNRFRKSATHGMIGGLAGYIFEHGLETATGMDFVNGVFEIAGATLGVVNANKDMIKQAYEGVVIVTGKEPAQLDNDEWEQVRTRYPKAVEYLERALAMR